MFVVAEFIEKPVADAVLFFWRQGRQLRDCGIQRSGHESSITGWNGAAQRALHQTAGWCDPEPPRLKRHVGPTSDVRESQGVFKFDRS